jgi:hypothetical protein
MVRAWAGQLYDDPGPAHGGDNAAKWMGVANGEPGSRSPAVNAFGDAYHCVKVYFRQKAIAEGRARS